MISHPDDAQGDRQQRNPASTLQPSLETALHSLGFALVLLDGADSALRLNSVRFANNQFLSLTGHHPTELLVHGWRLILGDQVDSGEFRSMIAATARREPTRGQFLIERRDRSRFWASLEITPVQSSSNFWITVIHDISDQVRDSEMDLRLRDQLQTSLESIREGVVTIDLTGNIIFANRRAEAFIGLDAQSAIGRPLSNCFKAKTHTGEPFELPLREILASGKSFTPSNPLTIGLPSGDTCTFSLDCNPVLDHSRHTSALTLTMQETGRSSRSESTAPFSTRLLSQGIAHDFNNLLTAIIGNLSIAAGTLRDGEARNLIGRAQEAASRAQDLSRQLMAVAKGPSIRKSNFSIRNLLRECAGFAVNTSPCRVRFALPDELPQAVGDENQISQVLNNLLINATQAMPTGGVIRVTAETRQCTSASPIQNLAPGTYLHIAIADEGSGIPKELMSRIFEPYFTTKKKGSGLGLASCSSILKNHGGCIYAESEPGSGATFHLFVPAAEAMDSNPRSTANEKHETKLIHGKGRVLVVDDEKMIRQITCDMLTHLGYMTEDAHSCDSAVERVRLANLENHPFQLFIIDLTIPGNPSGIEILRLLRERSPSTPALLFTGYSTNPLIANCRAHGFHTAICKPFNIQQLGAAVHLAITETEPEPRVPSRTASPIHVN